MEKRMDIDLFIQYYSNACNHHTDIKLNQDRKKEGLSNIYLQSNQSGQAHFSRHRGTLVTSQATTPDQEHEWASPNQVVTQNPFKPRCHQAAWIIIFILRHAGDPTCEDAI